MATHVISPGEFLVTDDPSAVLETTLGSCVGVALHDPEVRIGGILHVLLPCGNEDRESDTPARFARSGVPLILQEMERLGADRGRIQAFVAGGAMVVTDRPLSIELNIGRRNGAMVRQMLEEAGIPIFREEIGGNVGRALRLEVSTGASDVRTIGETRGREPDSNGNGCIGYGDLKLKIDKLKPLPEIIRRILLKMDDPEFSIPEVEQDILKDQALTANVLKVSNSARYGFRGKISSVNRALKLMGSKALMEIMLTTFAQNIYGRGLRGYSIRKGQLMHHSVCCGLVAELIAQEKRIPDVDIALTAGLLHDIGKVILDQYAFEKFNLIMDKVLNDKKTFLEAESEILGFNHAQVGGMVAKEWNLPEILVESISFHHQPEACRADSRIVAAVHLADSICSMFGEVCGADALSNPIHQVSIASLGLQRGDVERIIERLPEVVRQLETLS